MKSEVALSLIEDGVERNHAKQAWADLGAGNGVFTHALSTLLQDGSTVYAVDTNAGRMESIRVWQQVVLKRIQADFVRDMWSTELLNGILMANSLHFVKEKEAFLQRLAEKLTHDGRLVIVEYDMEKANAYVPYPIGFNRLTEVIQRSGFGTIKKLKEVPSVYDNRMIYSAVIY